MMYEYVLYMLCCALTFDHESHFRTLFDNKIAGLLYNLKNTGQTVMQFHTIKLTLTDSTVHDEKSGNIYISWIYIPES